MTLREDVDAPTATTPMEVSPLVNAHSPAWTLQGLAYSIVAVVVCVTVTVMVVVGGPTVYIACGFVLFMVMPLLVLALVQLYHMLRESPTPRAQGGTATDPSTLRRPADEPTGRAHARAA